MGHKKRQQLLHLQTRNVQEFTSLLLAQILMLSNGSKKGFYLEACSDCRKGAGFLDPHSLSRTLVIICAGHRNIPALKLKNPKTSKYFSNLLRVSLHLCVGSLVSCGFISFQSTNFLFLSLAEAKRIRTIAGSNTGCQQNVTPVMNHATKGTVWQLLWRFTLCSVASPSEEMVLTLRHVKQSQLSSAVASSSIPGFVFETATTRRTSF